MQVLLVKLDDNTISNAVADGHFMSKKEAPHYAISMGAELVYQAKTVLLLANGERKVGPLLNPSWASPLRMFHLIRSGVCQRGGHLITY